MQHCGWRCGNCLNYLLIASCWRLAVVGGWCYWFSCCNCGCCCRRVWCRLPGCHKLRLPSTGLPHINWNWLGGIFNCYLLIFAFWFLFFCWLLLKKTWHIPPKVIYLLGDNSIVMWAPARGISFRVHSMGDTANWRIWRRQYRNWPIGAKTGLSRVHLQLKVGVIYILGEAWPTHIYFHKIKTNWQPVCFKYILLEMFTDSRTLFYNDSLPGQLPTLIVQLNC